MADMHVKPLTARQTKALAALLTAPSQTDAAKISGLGERTLSRYLRDPHFTECYRRARHRQVEQAVAALQQSSGQAVGVLVDIATSTKTKSTARVQAARALIDGALRATELEHFESRLAALEKAVKKEAA